MPLQSAHYFEAKAAEAERQAASVSRDEQAEGWRYLATTYRWLAYHRQAFGKWQPPDGAPNGGETDLP